jgi:hypothetical protein
MKLVPLKAKKAISSLTHRLGIGTAIVLTAGSFLGGLGNMLYQRENGTGGPAEKTEETALQQKVDHLLRTYKATQDVDALAEMVGQPGTGSGVDPARAAAMKKSFDAAFNTEAQALGIALATARTPSPDERCHLYRQLNVIKPLPDYLSPAAQESCASFMLFDHSQSRVMDRTGFKPTLDAARDIVNYDGYPLTLIFAGIFGPMALSIAGVFAFGAAQRRLDGSIASDEAEARRKQEEARSAEAERLANAARRQAEDKARPQSTALEHDIKVKQIKLAPKS